LSPMPPPEEIDAEAGAFEKIPWPVIVKIKNSKAKVSPDTIAGRLRYR